MDVTFTYAVPVHILDLTANLTAYIKTKPVFHALRLCNRFGKGSQAFIARLPTELIANIEAHVLSSVRQEEKTTWQERLRCLEGRCEQFEHLDHVEKLKIFNTIRPEGEDHEISDRELDKLVAEALEQGLTYTSWQSHCQNVHRDQVAAMNSRITKFCSSTKELFDLGDHGLVTTDFGVDIWTSHLDLEASSRRKRDPPNTTLAYLIMPDAKPFHSVADAPPAPPPRRFERAMRILGLKILTHPNERDGSLMLPECSVTTARTKARSESEDEAADAPWPRLTLFIRAG